MGTGTRHEQSHASHPQPSPVVVPESPGATEALPAHWLERFKLDVARRLTRRALSELNHPDLDVELLDGSRLAGSGASRVRLRFNSLRTLSRVVRNPMLRFGEAYADGDVQVEGELTELLGAVDRALLARFNGNDCPKRDLRRRYASRNTIAASRQNIHHHYDIGNDFYRLWLDDQLVYTCAYFERPDLTLEEAQIAKMDHVCRKLQLRPGRRVIEAGCGWGALALHMARHYGVSVRAYNISREQIAYARHRAREEKLDARVEFIEDDWRDITGKCDAFVSVGMLEHVGIDNYKHLGGIIRNCLAPDGFALLHTIGQNCPILLNEWTDKYIFPGAQPPTLGELMQVLEPNGFSVLDVENLRLHYAETLKHWGERFERHACEVARMFDERFVRMWRFYLAASQSTFAAGWLQLFQVLFTRDSNHELSRNRLYQYAHALGADEAGP